MPNSGLKTCFAYSSTIDDRASGKDTEHFPHLQTSSSLSLEARLCRLHSTSTGSQYQLSGFIELGHQVHPPLHRFFSGLTIIYVLECLVGSRKIRSTGITCGILLIAFIHDADSYESFQVLYSLCDRGALPIMILIAKHYWLPLPKGLRCTPRGYFLLIVSNSKNIVQC